MKKGLFLGVFCLIYVTAGFAFGRKLNYPQGIRKTGEVSIDSRNYDIVTFGYFPQTKDLESGSIKIEPIEWRVALKKNGKALLIAEKELMAGIPVYEDFSGTRTVNGKTIYPNNYEYSEIRAYLNGLSFLDKNKMNTKWENKGFLQTAFSKDEQENILTSKVVNKVKGNKYVCRNTKDKVFLLSKADICDTALGFVNDESRIRPATDYAVENMAFRSGKGRNGGIWWVRTPEENYMSRTYIVNYTGEAGNKTNRTRDPITGIVPALWIMLVE